MGFHNLPEVVRHTERGTDTDNQRERGRGGGGEEADRKTLRLVKLV